MPVASTPSAPSKPQTKRRPVVLVVDDEPAVLELAGDILRREGSARVVQATCLAEARRVLGRETVSLVIVDVRLPDGDGTQLLTELKALQPDAAAIVVTGSATLEESLSCFRDGAIDYLPKPFTAESFAGRVRNALARQAEQVRTNKRLDRLRSAVRKLNGARRMVSKKVDLLCNDLVTAYGDLARQFEDVRVKENFRGTVSAATDLEQMLCHTMDWLLRQCGYSNIAIYLSNDEGAYDLGAYMKFTIAGSRELTEAMRVGACEQIARDEFVQWTDAEAGDALSPQELDVIPGHGLMGVNATYLGESLATVILFRDGKSPFTAEDAATLRAIAPIFAQLLTTIAKAEGEADAAAEEDEEDSSDPIDEIFDDQPKPQPKRRRDESRQRPKKPDDADWWKRGEAPPF